MRKLGVVFKREYVERVRSKWFIVGTFGPLLFGLLFAGPAYLSMRQRPAADLANVIVLDATGLASARACAPR
jgi:ABC-type Na+ efflux pump permease subunit